MVGPKIGAQAQVRRVSRMFVAAAASIASRFIDTRQAPVRHNVMPAECKN